MDKDTGGPAFPFWDENTGEMRTGLTMRDWLAGQALAGLVQNPHGDTIDPPEGYPAHAARVAYVYADSMLAARRED